MDKLNNRNKISYFIICALGIVLCALILLYLKKSCILDVPYIDQRERYPTGCESVSTVMALNYLGVDITVDEFISNYLVTAAIPAANPDGELTGGNPWKTFLGNPYSQNGYGCYAPVIVSAINKLVDGAFEAQARYGKPLNELCREYIDKRVPVILWATMDMKTPYISKSWTDSENGGRVEWIAPEHCLLLIGYDRNFYYFNDPLCGKNQRYKKSDVKTAYEGMYAQAVVITNR